MMEGPSSSDHVEFIYVLPNGYRVARIEFVPSAAGMVHAGHGILLAPNDAVDSARMNQ
jgi:hypothetical protein